MRTRVLSRIFLLTLILPLTGCLTQIRQLKTDNQMLEARVLQYAQDYEALQGEANGLQEKLTSAQSKLTEADKEIATLKERQAAVQKVMNESQKNQAEALVKDMEARIERENQLRLDLDAAQARVESLENEKMLLQEERDALDAEADDFSKRLAEALGKIDETTTLAEGFRAERDDARAERDDFRRQVQALQSNSTDLSKQLEEMSAKLRDAEKELATAQRSLEEAKTQIAATESTAQASTEARETLLATLRERLQPAAEAGKLQLRGEDDLRIAIGSDQLYQTGTVLLTTEGTEVLKTVADALEGLEYGAIRIEGHTDNVPVRSMPFVDNWDLAAARASTVTRWFATQSSVPARKLSAASFAFFAPVASNDNATGRKQNRRVEIVVVP